VIDVDNAILARWNNASLNSSIATLYPGGETASPEGTLLPRANYYSPNDPLTAESRGSLVKMKTYIFETWATKYETAGDYVKAISAAFLNSESTAAGSHPLQMDAHVGHIMSTHEADSGIEKLNDALFRGWYELTVRWNRNKVVP
jgi:hypothetical protein